MQEKYKFPCKQCGAKLYFSADDGQLKCSYCSYINIIDKDIQNTTKNDYEETLAKLKKETFSQVEVESTKCSSCGAVFEFDKNIHSSSCPYCSSPVVNDISLYKPIKPEAVLPFSIDESQARLMFKKWLDGMWFAPNKLKDYSSGSQKLKAIYIPYWIYDVDTHSYYKGRRGEKYYTSADLETRVDAKGGLRTGESQKIRWYDVKGELQKRFNDVIVIASSSIKHSLFNWDLKNLLKYKESYLSGYESEVYSIELDDGFESAKKTMKSIILTDIKRQIGGDEQEVDHIDTIYKNIKYKLVLLPIYASAFRFEGKLYTYVINGRNGDIRGDRPYSIVKIGLSLIGVAIVATLVYYFGGN
jgi:DNA-directed RNA polymerase subunit RPC12/RpoP